MSSLTPEQRKVLPLVFAVTLTGILGATVISPAIPDVLASFDQPDSSAGLLVAASSLPGIVLAPVIGITADRSGRRTILTACMATFGLGGVGSALAPNFELLLLSRCVLGMGGAGAINLAVVLIGDHFDGVDRTRMVGRNAAVLTIGVAAAPLLSGIITEALGWRWALAVNASGLVTAIAAWRLLDSGRPLTASSTIREQLGGVGHALRDRTIAVSLIGAAIAFAVMFGVFLATLPNHLEREFGLSAGWRGVMISLPAITSSIVGFNLGRIRTVLGLRLSLALAAATWVVAFVALGSAEVLGAVAIAVLLYGVGEGAMVPSLQEAAMAQAPAARGAVVAVWTGFARIGQTGGALLASAVVAGRGNSTVFALGAVGSASLLLLVLSSGVGRHQPSAVTVRT